MSFVIGKTLLKRNIIKERIETELRTKTVKDKARSYNNKNLWTVLNVNKVTLLEEKTKYLR